VNVFDHADVDFALFRFEIERLAADEAGRFLTGLRRRIEAPDNKHVRVYGPQPKALLGAAHICAGELIPDRLLSPAELQGLLDSRN